MTKNPDFDGSSINCYIHDLTDRNKAVQALRESEEKNLKERESYFRNIFENIDTGVVIYEAVDKGEDFIIFDMNKRPYFNRFKDRKH